VWTGVTISNGLEWSPDGARAYYNDTDSGQVAACDYDPESGLTNRRTFVPIPAETGRPDGLTVDVEGGVWVALNKGGVVHRYTADAVLDDVVRLPTANVTACTFGGPQLDELFITTSREGLHPGEDPFAGSLFRAHVGVRGRPARPFTG
jgi:sugar lactone lactonase YvrE